MTNENKNPYELGEVRTIEEFAGEKARLGKVHQGLKECRSENPRYKHFHVIGPQGYGKSSLMKIVELTAEKDGFAVIRPSYMILEKDKNETISLLKIIFDGLKDELENKIKNVANEDIAISGLKMQRSGVMQPATEQINELISCMINYFNYIFKKARKQSIFSIVLLFDDFDELIDNNKEFVRIMERIFSNVSGYNLIISGEENLISTMPCLKLKPIILKEFTSDEMKECILKPLNANQKDLISPEIFEVIDILTRRIPYAVKLFAYYMYDERLDKIDNRCMTPLDKIDIGCMTPYVLDQVVNELDGKNRPEIFEQVMEQIKTNKWLLEIWGKNKQSALAKIVAEATNLS